MVRHIATGTVADVGKTPHARRLHMLSGAPSWMLALCAISCGGRPAAPATPTTGDTVVLYRDRAAIRQHVAIDVARGATAMTRVVLTIAAGVAADDVVVLDPGGLVVTTLHLDTPAPAPRPSRAIHADTDDAPTNRDEPHGEPDPEALHDRDVPGAPGAPTHVELVVSAPRPGRYALVLGYTTDRLRWQVAYTMTTSTARDRATLRGALAIHNTTALAVSARAAVVDAQLGTWNGDADLLRRALSGAPSSGDTAPARPYDLGTLTLGEGDTRVELLAGAAPRAMRSVLVYDPTGTQLDHPGSTPVADPALGATTAAPPHVTESFEIERDPRTAPGPAGPVRLLERRADGAIALLGESQLFGPAAPHASVDTVAVGTAPAIVGHRERRDWARDDLQRRFSEEFLLTIDNHRPQAVDIVLREHLYRGQNWTLAYQSAPAVKEGPQQIALRTTVPANDSAKVLYVVVYTW